VAFRAVKTATAQLIADKVEADSLFMARKPALPSRGTPR
jgi:hypothetical protein